MRRSSMARAVVLGLVALLVLPAAAMADTFDAAGKGLPDSVGINSLWVIVAGCFVMFMQAGFAFLEIGFSRGKNAGTVVAKILTNFSIAAILYWAVGFAFAFGGATGHIIGDTGFFLRDFGDPQKAFPIMGLSDATIESKWFFQFVFCAVSLAIVWGTTLERIKFGVYVIYAIVFSALIYPIASGWVFGGGWLQVNVGMQDFAGSTAVHLIGATGALAALLLLGPRRGKYGPDGKARAIPGHNMPLFGLGVLILWLGWFGFNPGSTLGALDGRFTEVLLVTQHGGLRRRAGRAHHRPPEDGADRHRHGRQRRHRRARRHHRARRATSRRGPAWSSASSPASSSRSASTPSIASSTTRSAPSPRTVCAACGARCRAASSRCRRWRRTTPSANRGLFYSGSFHQLGAQALGVVTVFAFVFAASYGTFWAIKKTYGLRVTAEEEEAGLDISEHGMYGYPEQFIPIPELVGYGAAPHVATPQRPLRPRRPHRR